MVKKKTKKHRWDETMVIAVMIVSALCILFMLANYVTVTGQAHQSIVPTEEGFYNMLNGAQVFSGTASPSKPTKCNAICAKEGLTSVYASSAGQMTRSDEAIFGEYTCSCTSVMRVIGVVPEKVTNFEE